MNGAGKPTELRPIGAWFFAGSVLWWVGAAIAKEDFFLGDSAHDKALAIARDAGAFRAFHLMAGLGTVVASVGIVLLGRWLRSRRPSRLVDAAVSAAMVGTVAWIVEIAIRMTAGVDRARAVAKGTASPMEEPSVGNVLLFAISGLAFVAPMLVAWVLARRRVPGRKSSLALASVLTLVTAVAASTLAVSMVYQFGTLPLAAALLLLRPTGGNATSVSSSLGTPTVAGESIRSRT